MDALNAIIKFRCDKKLVARAKRIAKERERDFSDWLRRGFEKFLDAQERELHLPPLTAAEVAKLTTKTKRSGPRKKKGRSQLKPNVDAEVAAVIAGVAEQVQPSLGAPVPRQNDEGAETSPA